MNRKSAMLDLKNISFDIKKFACARFQVRSYCCHGLYEIILLKTYDTQCERYLEVWGILMLKLEATASCEETNLVIPPIFLGLQAIFRQKIGRHRGASGSA
jgi:hypothetical protein